MQILIKYVFEIEFLPYTLKVEKIIKNDILIEFR